MKMEGIYAPIPTAFKDGEIAYKEMKAAMDLVGHYGGEVRKPLIDLSDQNREESRRILKKVGV